MGYLSEKKSRKRTRFFLNFLAAALALAAFAASPPFEGFFRLHLPQWCFAAFALAAFAAWRGFFAQAALLALLFVADYFQLAAHANVFSSERAAGGAPFEIAFEPGKADILVDRGRNPMAITVDFSGKDREGIAFAFAALEDLVLASDGAAAVAGDFGVPAWSAPFEAFLLKTKLTVKNRLLFGWNPLKVPTVNVLGYENVGLEEVSERDGRVVFRLRAS